MYARNSSRNGNKIGPGSGVDADRDSSPLAHQATRRRWWLQVVEAALIVLLLAGIASGLVGCTRKEVKDAAAAAGAAGGVAGGPVGAIVASIITAVLGSLFVNEKVQHRKTKKREREAKEKEETARLARSKGEEETQLLPTQSGR